MPAVGDTVTLKSPNNPRFDDEADRPATVVVLIERKAEDPNRDPLLGVNITQTGEQATADGIPNGTSFVVPYYATPPIGAEAAALDLHAEPVA